MLLVAVASRVPAHLLYRCATGDSTGQHAQRAVSEGAGGV